MNHEFYFEKVKLLRTNNLGSKLRFAEALHLNLKKTEIVNNRNEGADIE